MKNSHTGLNTYVTSTLGDQNGENDGLFVGPETCMWFKKNHNTCQKTDRIWLSVSGWRIEFSKLPQIGQIASCLIILLLDSLTLYVWGRSDRCSITILGVLFQIYPINYHESELHNSDLENLLKAISVWKRNMRGNSTQF